MKLARWLVLVMTLLCFLQGCAPAPKGEETVDVTLLVGVDVEILKLDDTPDSIYEYRYDDRGLLTARMIMTEEPYVDKENTYDAQGNLRRVVYPTLDQEVEFDENGNLLMSRREGSLTINTYDRVGNILSQTREQDGVLLYTVDYTREYDEAGRPTRVEMRRVNPVEQRQSTQITLYQYDQHGQMIHKCVLADDDRENNTYYDYDDQGNVVREEFVSFNGFRKVTTNVYDPEGRLLEEKVQESDPSRTTVRTYDDAGYPLTVRIYQNDTQVRMTQYTYGDVPGQKLCVSVDYGNSKTEDRFTYDKKGNVLSREFVGGVFDRYTYEFSYVTVSVPAAFADVVQAQQNELIDEFLTKDLTVIVD